jgi:MFS family permease
LGISAALPLGLHLYSVYLAIALVGNCCCGYLVDRFGRRKYLLIGLVGYLFALTGETIFGILIDPNMYIYASEIFPSEVHTQGIAVSFSGQLLSFIAIISAVNISLSSTQFLDTYTRNSAT